MTEITNAGEPPSASDRVRQSGDRAEGAVPVLSPRAMTWVGTVLSGLASCFS